MTNDFLIIEDVNYKLRLLYLKCKTILTLNTQIKEKEEIENKEEKEKDEKEKKEKEEKEKKEKEEKEKRLEKFKNLLYLGTLDNEEDEIKEDEIKEDEIKEDEIKEDEIKEEEIKEDNKIVEYIKNTNIKKTSIKDTIVEDITDIEKENMENYIINVKNNKIINKEIDIIVNGDENKIEEDIEEKEYYDEQFSIGCGLICEGLDMMCNCIRYYCEKCCKNIKEKYIEIVEECKKKKN